MFFNVFLQYSRFQMFPGCPKMPSTWLQQGFNLASTWPQVGFNVAPTWFQFGFNLASRWLQDCPKTPPKTPPKTDF